MPELLDPVEALLTRPADLPPPSVRKALRKAHDRLTQEMVAQVVGVRRLAVARWEAGSVEPREPHRQKYSQLLRGLAAKHPEVPGATEFTEGA